MMAAYRRQRDAAKQGKKDLVDALVADLGTFRTTFKTGEWTGEEAEEERETLPQPSELRDLIRTELMLVMREDMQ